MASSEAWNAGWSLGSQIAQQRYLQKQGRANELWEDRRDELKANIANLAAKYSTLLGPNGEDTPASLQAKYALQQAFHARDFFENPPKTPGAMQHFEWLLHLSRRPQPQTFTTQIPGLTLGSEAPMPAVSNQPAGGAATPTCPSTKSNPRGSRALFDR